MSQAIVTRYLAPSLSHRAQVKAKCFGGELTLDYDHFLDPWENHLQVARLLVEKMEWSWAADGKSKWVYGVLYDGRYAFVQSKP